MYGKEILKGIRYRLNKALLGTNLQTCGQEETNWQSLTPFTPLTSVIGPYADFRLMFSLCNIELF